MWIHVNRNKFTGAVNDLALDSSIHPCQMLPGQKCDAACNFLLKMFGIRVNF